MSEESSAHAKDDVIGAYLTEADQNVLRAWYENLALLDPRYHDKRLRKVAARAMVDDEFRRRLVGETGTAVDANEPESPDRTEVRFHANTPKTLHVVLPPKAGAGENLPTALRDILRSRTSDAAGWFADDWNFSDPGGKDQRVILPPPHGFDGIDGKDLGPTGPPHPFDGIDGKDTGPILV